MKSVGSYLTPGSSAPTVTSASVMGGNPAQAAYATEYNEVGIKTNLDIPLTQVSSANNVGVTSAVGSSSSQSTAGSVSTSATITNSNTTGYDTGVGYWMGTDSDGIPKLFIGDENGDKVLWDGTTLTITGNLLVSSIAIPDAVTANSFHVDTSGNAWWGATVIGSATAKVLNTGVATFTNANITGGSVATATLNVGLMGWTTDIVFSSASATQVNWTSGHIVVQGGTTYTISSGNTGTMAALTYIYLDIGTSTTVLQYTTAYATATGDGKILIATAQNNTTGASVVPFGGSAPVVDGSQITASSITAGQIAASTITAAQMNVSVLSAITANLGTITAGTITVDASGYVRGGQTDYATGTGFFLGYSTDNYKFSVGNATNYLTWDGTYLRISGNVSYTSSITNVSYTVANLPVPPTVVGFNPPSAYA